MQVSDKITSIYKLLSDISHTSGPCSPCYKQENPHVYMEGSAPVVLPMIQESNKPWTLQCTASSSTQDKYKHTGKNKLGVFQLILNTPSQHTCYRCPVKTQKYFNTRGLVWNTLGVKHLKSRTVKNGVTSSLCSSPWFSHQKYTECYVLPFCSIFYAQIQHWTHNPKGSKFKFQIKVTR